MRFGFAVAGLLLADLVGRAHPEFVLHRAHAGTRRRMIAKFRRRLAEALQRSTSQFRREDHQRLISSIAHRRTRERNFRHVPV